MKLRGSLLVIVCCLVVEFCNFNQKGYLIVAPGNSIYFLSILGLLFLLYPLMGHLTDVYLTRYRSLKWSLVFLILAACMGAIYMGILIPISIIENFHVFQPSYPYLYVAALIIIVYVIGLGLFQANAIQFGLDQLLEAPTPKLIAFIYWYYWAQNVGSLAFFYVVGSTYFILELTDKKINGTISQFLDGHVNNTIIVCFLIPITIAVTAVLIKFGLQRSTSTFRKPDIILSKIFTKFSSTLGSTRSLSIAVPSPTGRRIFHAVLTWGRTNMEDHSPMRRWRTLRHSYAFYHSSCVCLDTI